LRNQGLQFHRLMIVMSEVFVAGVVSGWIQKSRTVSVPEEKPYLKSVLPT